MRVLIIGGTGLISRGIVKHLLARGAEVTVFNRAQREDTLPREVNRIRGDRNQLHEFERTLQAPPKPSPISAAATPGATAPPIRCINP